MGWRDISRKFYCVARMIREMIVTVTFSILVAKRDIVVNVLMKFTMQIDLVEYMSALRIIKEIMLKVIYKVLDCW